MNIEKAKNSFLMCFQTPYKHDGPLCLALRQPQPNVFKLLLVMRPDLTFHDLAIFTTELLPLSSCNMETWWYWELFVPKCLLRYLASTDNKNQSFACSICRKLHDVKISYKPNPFSQMKHWWTMFDEEFHTSKLYFINNLRPNPFSCMQYPWTMSYEEFLSYDIENEDDKDMCWFLMRGWEMMVCHKCSRLYDSLTRSTDIIIPREKRSGVICIVGIPSIHGITPQLWTTSTDLSMVRLLLAVVTLPRSGFKVQRYAIL